MPHIRPLVLVLAAVVSVAGASMVGWGLFANDGVAAGITFPVSGPTSPTVDPAEVARQREEAARKVREGKERRLTAALDSYAADHPEFALALVDNRTGRRYSYEGSKRLEMASIVKVDILAALLLKAQRADRGLTARELALAEDMITVSSNDAATALFDAIGGVSGLNAANKRLGLKKTTANPSWGLTRTTAEDQAKLISVIFDEKGPLDRASRRTITDLMTSVAPEQRWGVKAAVRPSEKIALKNGWLSRDTESGLFIINSLGRVTGDGVDMSIAVLSHGHKTMPGGIKEVERVAAMARQYLGW